MFDSRRLRVAMRAALQALYVVHYRPEFYEAMPIDVTPDDAKHQRHGACGNYVDGASWGDPLASVCAEGHETGLDNPSPSQSARGGPPSNKKRPVLARRPRRQHLGLPLQLKAQPHQEPAQ